LTDEQPQTIALILSHLPATKAFDVLYRLPPDTRADVAMRIATMEQTPAEVIEEVAGILQNRMSSVLNGRHSSAGGVEHLVAILTKADRTTEHAILQYLDQNSPELAETVRLLIFVFEDIGQLDDAALQRLLREVDPRDLAVALRTSSELMRERVFHNLSTRAAESLREDMDLSPPVRQRQIEEAQQRIVSIARRLDEAGEIIIQRGSDNVLI
ncbi:MAG: flagellar motor switch protein FliG, partial [Chloroflexota bacterium]|nr:flagellar motor switch protein FliG [Chloroflexota bacterium]